MPVLPAAAPGLVGTLRRVQWGSQSLGNGHRSQSSSDPTRSRMHRELGRHGCTPCQGQLGRSWGRSQVWGGRGTPQPAAIPWDTGTGASWLWSAQRLRSRQCRSCLEDGRLGKSCVPRPGQCRDGKDEVASVSGLWPPPVNTSRDGKGWRALTAPPHASRLCRTGGIWPLSPLPRLAAKRRPASTWLCHAGMSPPASPQPRVVGGQGAGGVGAVRVRGCVCAPGHLHLHPRRARTAGWGCAVCVCAHRGVCGSYM